MESQIEIIDLSKIKSGYARKIDPSKVTMTYSHSSGGGMSFNQQLSAHLNEIGYLGMNLAYNNLTGEVFFVFSNRGYALKFKSKTIRISNTAIYKLICNYLKVKVPILQKGENTKITLTISENLSNRADSETYKILEIKKDY